MAMNYFFSLLLLAVTLCETSLLAMKADATLQSGKNDSKTVMGLKKPVDDEDTEAAGEAPKVESKPILKKAVKSSKLLQKTAAQAVVKKDEEKKDGAPPFPQSVAYFDRDVWKKILKLINSETKGIWAAIYRCNYSDFVDKWSAAIKTKKLVGCFLLSREYEDEHKTQRDEEAAVLQKFNDSRLLVKRVNVLNGNSFSEMHNKFIIFESNKDGRPVLVVGTCNATKAAANHHYEDCAFIYDPNIIAHYVAEFRRMYNDSVPLNAEIENPANCKLKFAEPIAAELNAFPKVEFRDAIKNLVLNLISWENKKIVGAQFIVISSDVADAWHKRYEEKEIKGMLLIDRGYKTRSCAALRRLIKESKVSLFELSVPFFPGSTGARNIHHKYLLFLNNRNGRPVLLSGSANLSDKSHLVNWENCFATEDTSLIGQYALALKTLRDNPLTKAISEADLEDPVEESPALSSYAFDDE